MSRYRKVSTCVWGDEKFRALTAPKPCGQFLWFKLLTGEHTSPIPGLSLAGEAGLAESLRWPLTAFRKCWREVADQGMGEADWTARVVFLPNAIEYNEPESPSVVKGWVNILGEIPECALKRKAIFRIGKYLRDEMGSPWAAAWVTGWESAWNEGSQPGSASSGTGAGAGTGAGTGELPLTPSGGNGHRVRCKLPESAEWGEPCCLMIKYNLEVPDSSPAVDTPSQKRLEKERKYLDQFPDEAWWTATFRQYHRSRFLRNLVPKKAGHESFTPDFDWLLSVGKDGTENCVKVHDGRYCDGA